VIGKTILIDADDMTTNTEKAITVMYLSIIINIQEKPMVGKPAQILINNY
jgi:hypothetical protein